MRRIAVLGAAVLAAVGLIGCAGVRTERQGRNVGRAICDVKTADNTDQAQRALKKLNRHLVDAQRITGRPVSSDLRDIQNNLKDLVRHASSGSENLAREDVAVIQRNVQAVVQTAPALVKRFYEGVVEGLGDCT